MFDIPQNIDKVLSALEAGGYEAFIVGGCVRDYLLGVIPHDFDIATDALPCEMKGCFKDFHVIETGLKHGTLTVLSDGEPVEVTTYRIDGDYPDRRRPESVTFTGSLREDLARRDFTINAMAYSRKTGIIDCFGGCNDLADRRIRAVGEPLKRFSEDALRIMRAIRFSAVLGFNIEKETENAVLEMKDTLSYIAAERISAELEKLIMGSNCYSVLMEYHSVIEVFIPEISACIGFKQHNKYHKYDVWEHTAVAVASSRRDRIIRLAMLLHDISKPQCFTIDEKGQGHFHRHEQYSAEKAHEILKRLRFDSSTSERVAELIYYHYYKPQDNDKSVRKMLSKLGKEAFFQLLDVQRADARAKKEFCLERLSTIDSLEIRAKDIISRGECFQLKNLSVNGRDMIGLGLRGKDIGDALDRALQMVIDGQIANEKNALLNMLKN